MFDTPTYVNEITLIGGLQYKNNKDMKRGKQLQEVTQK